jgi:hypothetical protein
VIDPDDDIVLIAHVRSRKPARGLLARQVRKGVSV